MSEPPRHLLPIVLAFVFLSVASGTMVNVALPYLGVDLRADEATYAWVITGFTLTFGVFSAVHGRLGDLFGVRRTYLVGVLGFGVGSVAAGLAPTVGTLIAVRVVQGAFAAAIPSLGATMVSRLLPPERRGASMGAIVATVGVSASIAPFLGGALISVFGWRAVFLATGAALLGVPVAWRVLPASLDDVPRSGRFDGLGAALLGGGAGAWLVATDLVARRGPDALTVACAVGGAVLLGAFWWWSHRAAAPFAPPAVLRSRRFQALVAGAALANATRYGTLVLVPIVLEDVYREGPFQVGLALFPGAVLLAVLSPVAGRMADRLGPRAVAGPGIAGMLVACLLAAVAMDHGLPGIALAMAVYGAAFACVQPPLLGSVGAVVPREHQGIATGLYLMLFFLGGAFGVATSITVLGAQGDAAWLAGSVAGTGRFTGATLSLAVLAVGSLAVVPALPGRAR